MPTLLDLSKVYVEPWLTERTEHGTLPLDVHKVTAYVEVPHELLCAQIGHVCGESCPPPYVPPTLTRRQRLTVWRLRQVARGRRLGGLRIAHRDRIDQERDDR